MHSIRIFLVKCVWWWISLFVTHFLVAFLPTKTNLFTQRNAHLVGDFGSILDLTFHYRGSQVSSKPQLSLICLAISPPPPLPSYYILWGEGMLFTNPLTLSLYLYIGSLCQVLCYRDDSKRQANQKTVRHVLLQWFWLPSLFDHIHSPSVW